MNSFSKSRDPIIAVWSFESNLTNSSSNVTISSFGSVGVGASIPGLAATGVPGSISFELDLAASSKYSRIPEGKTSTVVAVVFIDV